MPDPLPPTTKPPTTASGSELPPRLLAKLKVEIDGYELIERLGEGGQATVYRGIQKKDAQMVAIKVLHAGPHATEEARARLKREINALRAINHPNIVHAIAAGRTRSGLDCLVMNFIDGKPLDALWADPAFAATVAPQSADLLRLFKTICETVQAAHRKGITHRDLSPSNILIDAKGQPHILDFGMASTAFDGIVTRNVTVTGQFIGKLKYASPEQARGAGTAGEGVDIRSDVYALGVMLYQLLTGGAFPYEVVGNVIDVLNNIIHSKPKPPSETIADLHTPTATLVLPKSSSPTLSATPIRRNPPLVNETIEAIVLKSLEKEPEKRYQSAGELAADIDRYLAGQPTSAIVWSKRPKPTSKFSIRRRPILAAASLIFIATLVGVIMNAKSLAVWLGLSTVVAPVLPTDHSALVPETSEAAMLLEFAQPEGSDGQLNKLAADLARVDARLRAVHERLSNDFARKSPEVQDGVPSTTRPLRADDLIAFLAKFSKETGREINFEPLSKDDRDQEMTAEMERFAREPDEATLITRRAELDAQQAGLWAKLSWGTFTGRKPEALYRYRLKTPPTANANLTQKAKVLDTGVKIRRLAADAMGRAAMAVHAQTGAGEGAGADLAVSTSDISDQLKTTLSDFLNAILDAKDKGGLSDEDAKLVNELNALAEQLRDAVNGAPASCGNVAKAQDEQARFTSRGTLQRDLRTGSEAAARLDQRLVEVARTWQIEPDTDSPLKPIITAAKSRPKPEKPVPAVRADPVRAQFPVGSIWRVRGEDGVGTVSDIQGDTVRMNMKWPTSAPRIFTLRVKGNDVSLIRDDADGTRPDGRPAAVVTNLNVTGIIQNGKITLAGSRSRSSGNGAPVIEKISYNIDLQASTAISKGSKYDGVNRANNANDQINAEVLESTSTRLKIQTRNTTGAIWEWTFDRTGDDLTLKANGFNKLQPNAEFQNDRGYKGKRGVFPEVTASGTVRSDGITFSFHWPQPGVVYSGTFDLTPKP